MRAGTVLACLAALPEAGLADILGGGRALILSPHPDDESLGCGGLIALACAAGAPPIVAILTDGAGSHPGSLTHPPSRLAAIRAEEVGRAVAELGLPPECLLRLGRPDGDLARHEDAAVAALLPQAAGAGAIVAAWRHDPHGDHEATAGIARRLAIATGRRLFFYPVWGWLLPEDAELDTPPPGGLRLDVGGQLDAKRRAIAAHASQHGHVVHDAPDGFVLPTALLAACDGRYEVFIDA